MRVSERIEGLTPGGDDGWGIFHRARALEAQGLPILNLTIGEHDIRTDPAILDAMHRAARAGATGYAAIPGIAPLRDAIAARLTEATGVPTARDNVLVTPGGQAALFAAHMIALDPGDRGLMIDPYYATYPGTIRAAGGIAVPVTAPAETGFLPRAADLRAAAPGARSLLVNTPNNPTGAVYPVDTLETIAAVCHDHDLWLISDEVYDTQVWQGAHVSPRALPGMGDRTLVVGSLSKSHAMTGSRLGWLVGPAEAIRHAVLLATHITYGVPGYIQDAGLFALAQGPAFEAGIAAPFARRRAAALARLDGHPALRAVPSGGAMYLMLDIRATGLSGTAFAEALLDEAHIAVMPGESFGTAAAGHVRIALTLPDEAFAEAFARLVSFAEARVAARHTDA